MAFDNHHNFYSAALLYIYLGFSLCFDQIANVSQNTDEKISVKSTNAEDLNILEGLALPIPPQVRKEPMVKLKKVADEAESVPKHIRLPNIDGIKVKF